MGLGPPVCLKCMVIGTLDTNREIPWFCEICGSEELNGHLFMLGRSAEKELEDNYFFYKAINEGKETKE